MTGGTRKRGGSWSYYFDLGKVDGKRQKKEKGGFKTKKEAEAALAKAINEYNNAGSVFEPSKITVADYMEFWLKEYALVNCRSNSVRNHKQAIELHINPHLGKYRLKALTPAIIQQWLNALKAEGYSKQSLLNWSGTLTGALNYAVYPMQYIQSNPCKYTKMPKMDQKQDKPKEEKRFVIPPEDFKKLTENFGDSSRYYLPLMIGYYTGMRVGEIFGLAWDDIDMEKRTITVKRTMISGKVPEGGGSRWYYNPPKSETSVRTIKFGETLYKVLKDVKQRKQKNRLSMGGDYMEIYSEDAADRNGVILKHLIFRKRSESCSLPPLDMVNVTDKGAFCGIEVAEKACRETAKALGIRFNFHSLRHTHATMLIENGVPVKAVSERLGHANASITMDVYTHNTERQQNEAVDIFERLTKQA